MNSTNQHLDGDKNVNNPGYFLLFLPTFLWNDTQSLGKVGWPNEIDRDDLNVFS